MWLKKYFMVYCAQCIIEVNRTLNVNSLHDIVHRPLAYSTLADLVHHVRHSLTLTDLSLAVTLFSKNVHDETLPSSIQTMSCKLLLNLVECIRSKSDQESGNVSDSFFVIRGASFPLINL